VAELGDVGGAGIASGLPGDGVLAPLTPDDPATIGPYTVIARLGAGGMGRVYLARAEGGDPVAIKVVRAELLADDGFRRRFADEVSAARQVAGFCTAPVLDADPDAPLPYLVTEYIDGVRLDRMVTENGPLVGSTLTGLAVGMAAALVAIHGAGLVHRDLKPSNVLLSLSGPRVIDFGIARSMRGSREASSGGLVFGSAGWMAPEQINGMEVEPSADVFSWGILVAYAGTGRNPFGIGQDVDIAFRIVAGVPDLVGLEDPPRRLVIAALAKNPADRPSAQDLLLALIGSGGMPPGPGGALGGLGGPEPAEPKEVVSPPDSPGSPGRPERELAGAGAGAATPPGGRSAAGPRGPEHLRAAPASSSSASSSPAGATPASANASANANANANADSAGPAGSGGRARLLNLAGRMAAAGIAPTLLGAPSFTHRPGVPAPSGASGASAGPEPSRPAPARPARAAAAGAAGPMVWPAARAGAGLDALDSAALPPLPGQPGQAGQPGPPGPPRPPRRAPRGRADGRPGRPPRSRRRRAGLAAGGAALLVLVGVIVFALTAGPGGGGSPPKASPSPSASPTTPSGVDGTLQFTVTGVNCGQTKLGSLWPRETAKGQYCLIQVSVRNTGPDAVTLSNLRQYLHDSAGKRHTADFFARWLIADGSIWNSIPAGGSVTGTMVFDIPKTARPVSLELHAGMLSHGVTIKL